MAALNRKLEGYLDRDHQIGHSYLMNLATVADLRFAWEHKVMPLLQEYFYGDGEKLKAVLGADFFEEHTISLGEGDSSDSKTIFSLKPTEADQKFITALQRLAGT